MGLFTTFYDAPTPNQVWQENKEGKKVIRIKKHHEESWVELFIDLIYVGLFITLSLSFKECSGKEGLSSELFVSIGTVILIMFTFRIAIDSFSNRFLSDDLFGRLLYLFYAYGLALIVLDVDGAEEKDCYDLGMQTDGFIVGYMICRAMSIVMLATAMFSYPDVVPQYAYQMTVKMLIFILSFFMIGFRDGRPTFLLVSNVVEFLLLVVFGGVGSRFLTVRVYAYPSDANLYLIPLNLSVAQRRLCMWCMMILGESVIQLVEPDIDQTNPERTYWYFTAGVILIFTYALLYCDSVLRENLDVHAMRRSTTAAAVWVWMHPVVGFSLFIIGVSIKLCFSSVVSDKPVSNEHNYMLGLGCGCTVIFLMVMRGTHKGLTSFQNKEISSKTLKRLANYLVRLILAVSHFIVADISYNAPDVEPGDKANSRDQPLYVHAALAASSVIIEMIAARLSRSGQTPPDAGHHSHHADDDDNDDKDVPLQSMSDSENPVHQSTRVELGSTH